MKITVTIEHEGKRFEGVAEDARDPAKGVALAERIAIFEMRRRPGCTCKGATLPSDRCNSTMMRCQGAVSAHLAAKGPVAAIVVSGAKGNEGADSDCG